MNWSRGLLFILILSVLATTIFSAVFFENSSLIKKWNIPACPPHFLDSRQLAWAAEAHAQGYDPLIENPVNPRGHQLNYPRIWHILFMFDIDARDTNVIGTIVVILFFIGIGFFWFSKRFDSITYIALSLVILSPAVMLGIERSNIELIIFALLAIALTVNYYSVPVSLIVVEFAAILKIYPVFGFVYLLKENRRRFWILFIAASSIFAVYALLSFNDFLQVYKTTPQLVGSSFGINVWWRGLKHPRFFNLPLSDTISFILQITSYLLALIIVITTFYLGVYKNNDSTLRTGNYLDAFRVGASIYIGCFLLMNTHDYRLIFLIFTIPQIIEWLRLKDKGISPVPFVTLAAMIFSLWSFFMMRFLGRKITFAMEELSNWIVLTGFLYLFFITVPDWLREYLLKPSSVIKRINQTKRVTH
jgi:hypothetical protein